ncbi:unnamed protein product [Mytilus coruscus]|uniref:Uncharacterized protein n=1 Tax=Mytilus coruscus TaxID=42192 RepID=A0A6J7ZZH9_MYTCO|nr:unnamed protein product [Mytilus coruscus]
MFIVDLGIKQAAQQQLVVTVREEMNDNNRKTMTACDQCHTWYTGVHLCLNDPDAVPGVTAADGTIAQPSEDKSSGNIELVNSFVGHHPWGNGRWKTLLRAYKAIKDNNKKSGAGKKSYEYEEQMDEIFGKDPAVTRIVTASSTSSGNKRKIDDSADQSLQKSETKRPKCSPTSEMVSLLKQYTENQENRYNADLYRREQQFRERMANMKDLVNVLKTFKE